MIRPFPIHILVALIFFILIIQMSAIYWHLHFRFWWLDIPEHILGGLWVALFGLSSFYASVRIKEKDHSAVFVVAFAVSLTLSVGLIWEIYEFWVNHAVGDFGIGLADTLTDLVDDLIGALLGAFIFIRGEYHSILAHEL